MTPDQTATPDPLAQLRDIHLPDPVAFWPPAPGWWRVTGLALTALVLGAVYLRARRHFLRRRALEELRRLEAEHGGDIAALAAGLSPLLKRVALARFGRTRVAALHGRAWLEFLKSTGGGFTGPVGEAMALAPYARGSRLEGLDTDGAAILREADRWIRRNS